MDQSCEARLAGSSSVTPVEPLSDYWREQANSHVIHICPARPKTRPAKSRLLWRTKGEYSVILLPWVGSGRRQFGSGTQERFAANARLLFRLLIEEASGSVNDAQE